MDDKVWQLRKSLIEEDMTNNEPNAEATELLGVNSSGDATSVSRIATAELNNSDTCHVSLALDDEVSVKNSRGNGVSLTSMHSRIKGSEISFKDVKYEVKKREKPFKGCCSSRKETQYIVKDVCGIFRPGVNAILGPTGSGKTSLLDILAGRKSPIGQSGSVLVDGSKQPANYKCMIGYVIQDDMVMGMLTVRENIEFSAALRLPSGTSDEKRMERVEEIIADLGLTKCANTKVGNEFRRGVSGGERKRTNIAMELITSPPVLFLDEPTTGLDSNTAHSVMLLLKSLSVRGMTVIISLHQPRYSIYKLFDTLMLMSGGQCVFHGPAQDGLEYFQSGGYVCEEHNNPPDFFLDVLNGCVPCTALLSHSREPDIGDKDDSSARKSNGISTDLEGADYLPEPEAEKSIPETEEYLVNLYHHSKWNKKLQLDLSVIHKSESRTATNGVVVSRSKVTYPTSPVKQFAIVASRTWHNMVRNRHALMTQLLSAVILGLIVGSIYFRVDDSCTTGIDNRIGAFFFIAMNYIFGNMSAVDIFIKERAIFIHETVSGFYRVSAYFFAKLFCDISPQRVFPIMIFAVITYFMIGFQMAAEKFFFYLLNIILTSLSGVAVALLFSASTRQHAIGTVFTALVWVCMMVFSGRMVKVETIPVWLQWLKWFSIFRYSMNAFMINELKDFDCTVSSNTTFYRCTSGDECLTMYGLSHNGPWDLWSNELALLLLAVGFLLLTYIQLRRTTALK